MNSLYLILIGICFTVGVLVTSVGKDNDEKMKQVCEESKKKADTNIETSLKEDNNSGSWFSFEKGLNRN